MAEIVIPFHEDFKLRMLNGRKTATTRSKRYGYPGDWFRVFGEVFVLREVFPTFIDSVADYFFFEEGFDHSHEFIDFWDRIHPRIKFRDNPGRRVYHHRFSLVHEGGNVGSSYVLATETEDKAND